MPVLNARDSHPRDGGPSYSFGHRVERAIWMLVWNILGIWTPTPFHAWRRFLSRMFGARIARSAKIYPHVRIWYARNLQMGPHACLGPHVRCYSVALVVLDEYALVSQYAYLCSGTHDIDDPDFQLVAKPIHIQKNAWVAADAYVGPGVTIGTGAVLGARGVATRDLSAWTVYSGNPATVVRTRRSF